MRSSSKGWFCQKSNGLTRHWTSWWGPFPEIDLFSWITYLLWGCDGRRDGAQSPQLCLPRHYLNLEPIYDGPNPRTFWSHFQEVTLGKEEPRHLELALHLPWGSVGLVSTFRGHGFLSSFLFISCHLQSCWVRLCKVGCQARLLGALFPGSGLLQVVVWKLHV